jgi:hypothetical protein
MITALSSTASAAEVVNEDDEKKQMIKWKDFISRLTPSDSEDYISLVIPARGRNPLLARA